MRAFWKRMVVVAACTLMGSSAAWGQDLDEVLGGLKWGDKHLTVCNHLKDQIMSEYKEEVKTVVDAGEQDKLRRQYEQEFESVKQTFRWLKDRRKSGLATSIVRDEFKAGNHEAVLEVKEDNATKYYFFLNDRLYKVAIYYQPDALTNVDFPGFIGLLAGRYGKDFEQVYTEDDYLEAVVWETPSTRLRVEDHTPIMKTYLLVFTDRALEGEVAKLHAEDKVKRQEALLAQNDEIDNLSGDEGGKEESGADSILDEKVDGIDMPEGEVPDGEKEGVETQEGETKLGEDKKKRSKGSVKRRKGSDAIDPDKLDAPSGQNNLIVW